MQRRLRGCQIEIFKRLNVYENIDRNMFFFHLGNLEELEETSVKEHCVDYMLECTHCHRGVTRDMNAVICDMNAVTCGMNVVTPDMHAVI